MAGHSKWANIKHRKGAQDKKRAKIFTKLIRELTVAAKMGGDDPGSNPRLRAAIQAANSANLPKNTMEKAIARGAKNDESANLVEIMYEGYAPSGVAVMVDCLTDNKNRTVAEVRHGFSKLGGNLGTDGSVSYLFTKQGQIIFDNSVKEEDIMDRAIDAGAEDILTNDDSQVVLYCAFEDYYNLLTSFEDLSEKIVSNEITMSASTMVELDLEVARKVLNLIDALEDLDDVQNVHTNADVSDEVLAKLNEEG
jgi:YebC/PmpR family DNA-binding regulatory protein